MFGVTKKRLSSLCHVFGWIQQPRVQRIPRSLQDSLVSRFRTVFKNTGIPVLAVGWAGAASVLLQISTVATSIIVARLLGMVEFGKFSVVLSTGGMFIGVAAGGLGIAATRYTARYAHSDPERVGRILALASGLAVITGGVSGTALLLLSKQISQTAFGLPTLTASFRISAIYLFFTTLNGYQVGAAVGLGAFRTIALVNAVQCGVALIVVSAFTAFGGVPGAIFGMSLSACLTWAQYKVQLNRLLRQRGITLDYHNCTQEMSVFWSFAMPSAISGIIGAAAVWLAATFLVLKSAESLKEVALFNAAVVLRQCTLFPPTIIQKVVSVSLSGMFGRVEPHVYKRVLRRNVTYITATAFAASAGLFVLRGPILHVFGKDFLDPHHVSAYVLLFAVTEVYATSVYQTIPAIGAMWYQVWVMLLWAGSLIGASYYLIPAYGAVGLAAAYLITWFAAGVAYSVISHVLLKNPDKLPRGTTV